MWPLCQHSWVAAVRLQAEPAPQGAADLQAGLAALTAVRTPHIQFAHLSIDLCRPHSACAQVPSCPAWHSVYCKA